MPLQPFSDMNCRKCPYNVVRSCLKASSVCSIFAKENALCLIVLCVQDKSKKKRKKKHKKHGRKKKKKAASQLDLELD